VTPGGAEPSLLLRGRCHLAGNHRALAPWPLRLLLQLCLCQVVAQTPAGLPCHLCAMPPELVGWDHSIQLPACGPAERAAPPRAQARARRAQSSWSCAMRPRCWSWACAAGRCSARRPPASRPPPHPTSCARACWRSAASSRAGIPRRRARAVTLNLTRTSPLPGPTSPEQCARNPHACQLNGAPRQGWGVAMTC